MILKIFTDGAARGNPGQSASGFDIYFENKLEKSFVKYNNINTNNFAEYTAIIFALKWCKKNINKDDEIEIYSDSLLIISQINHRFKVKAKNLLILNTQVQELKSHFKKIKFIHVNRTNKEIIGIDRKLNLFLDKKISK